MLTKLYPVVERWFPSPFLRTSVLFQLVGWPLSGSGVIPSPLLPEALLLNHVVAFAASLHPRSTWLGPNMGRLPPERAAAGHIAVTFDDGPDPGVTPLVLDILDQHGAKATFFCIGERARRYPGLVREIVARGHQIENHSDRHSNTFALQGPRALAAELRHAQASLAALTGREPRFFRAPFGVRNPWVVPVLGGLGLSLVSWTRRGYDAVLGNPDGVTALLLRNLCAGDILLLHDGSCARNRSGEAVVTVVLPRLLNEAARLGLCCSTLELDSRGP